MLLFAISTARRAYCTPAASFVLDFLNVAFYPFFKMVKKMYFPGYSHSCSRIEELGKPWSFIGSIFVRSRHWASEVWRQCDPTAAWSSETTGKSMAAVGKRTLDDEAIGLRRTNSRYLTRTLKAHGVTAVSPRSIQRRIKEIGSLMSFYHFSLLSTASMIGVFVNLVGILLFSGVGV